MPYFQPGRVVTLLPTDDADDTVWGIAYKIKQEDSEQVTQHLDYREKNGYTRKSVVFYPQDPKMDWFPLTLYIATEDNESYAGKSINLYNELVPMLIDLLKTSGSNLGTLAVCCLIVGRWNIVVGCA